MSAAVSADAIQSKTRCLRLNGSVQVRELAFFLQGIFQNENTFFILNQFEQSSEANAELARTMNCPQNCQTFGDSSFKVYRTLKTAESRS